MTTYTKITDYASKDALLTGNPSKVVRGTEIDAEFTAIASADADSVKTSALGTGVATFLATPSSANLAAAVTGETGSGALVFGTSPTLVTPALGTPSALVGTNITGTAAGLTAGSVTTNANLTGPITSVGNATSIASQTGTGTKFVVDTSPTLVTPILGVATGTSFQGIIGNVTPAAGTFTTLTSTGNATIGDAEASDTHSIKGATTILSNSGSAALTVTQTGAGNAFVVEDSASPDGTPFVISADGSVSTYGVTSLIKSGATGYMWRAYRSTSTSTLYAYDDGTDVQITMEQAGSLKLGTSNTDRLTIDSAGAVTIGGTLSANGQTVGYLNIPQNSQSAPYTLVLGDAGKHILHPSADTTARTITIPANASVAFPIGTAVTFVNQASAGVMTIAITTDTMRLAGAGTTGSRTLAANGVATAIKLTSTEWIISGTNLT